jgi:hypothetical protein
MLYSIFFLCRFAGHFKNWNTPGPQERVARETTEMKNKELEHVYLPGTREARGFTLYMWNPGVAYTTTRPISRNELCSSFFWGDWSIRAD